MSRPLTSPDQRPHTSPTKPSDWDVASRTSPSKARLPAKGTPFIGEWRTSSGPGRTAIEAKNLHNFRHWQGLEIVSKARRGRSARAGHSGFGDVGHGDMEGAGEEEEEEYSVSGRYESMLNKEVNAQHATRSLSFFLSLSLSLSPSLFTPRDHA